MSAHAANLNGQVGNNSVEQVWEAANRLVTSGALPWEDGKNLVIWRQLAQNLSTTRKFTDDYQRFFTEDPGRVGPNGAEVWQRMQDSLKASGEIWPDSPQVADYERSITRLRQIFDNRLLLSDFNAGRTDPSHAEVNDAVDFLKKRDPASTNPAVRADYRAYLDQIHANSRARTQAPEPPCGAPSDLTVTGYDPFALPQAPSSNLSVDYDPFAPPAPQGGVLQTLQDKFPGSSITPYPGGFIVMNPHDPDGLHNFDLQGNEIPPVATVVPVQPVPALPSLPNLKPGDLNQEDERFWRRFAEAFPDNAQLIGEAAHDATPADMAEAIEGLRRGASGSDVAAWLRDGGFAGGRVPPSGRRPGVVGAAGDPGDGTSGAPGAAISIRQIGERLQGGTPLDPDEAAQLVSLALGGQPETPLERRDTRGALDKLGLSQFVDNLPAAQRAILDRLGMKNGDELIGAMIGSPRLTALIKRFPEVASATLTRPKTLQALGQHPEARDFMVRTLERLAAEESRSIATGEPIRLPPEIKPGGSRLTPWENAVSERVAGSLPPRTESFQAGFDPAWATDPQRISDYLAGLYEASRAARPDFERLVQAVDAETGGSPEVRPGEKSPKRALDKIAKYEGDASRMTDLLAGRVVFDSVEDLYRALDAVSRRDDVSIVGFEDRIRTPQPSGYRDVTLNVRLPNGHIAEIHLELSPLTDYSKRMEHTLYEVFRDLRSQADEQGRKPTPSEEFIRRSIRHETIPEYNRLYDGVR